MSKFRIPDKVLYVCVGSKCSKRGGKDFYKLFKSYSKAYIHEGEIEIIKVECTDRCKFAPVLSIQPDNIWLKEYTEKEALNLVERLLIEKNIK